MLADDKTSTGTTWEYVNQHLEPGLGLFTSLSAAWAGAPTYLLTRHVAGIQQADGVAGFGYGNWVINPSAGLAMGLTSASAKVVTAFGGNLSVSWTVGQGTAGMLMAVIVQAPVNTSGVFVVNGVKRILTGSGFYQFAVTL